MKTRRNLLATLGAAALAAAFPALAQPKPFRVAWASPTKAADGSPFLEELRRGLRELGYVELPTQVELVVNLGTAKALGIAVPQAVLLRAHRVIE